MQLSHSIRGEIASITADFVAKNRRSRTACIPVSNSTTQRARLSISSEQSAPDVGHAGAVQHSYQQDANKTSVFTGKIDDSREVPAGSTSTGSVSIGISSDFRATPHRRSEVFPGSGMHDTTGTGVRVQKNFLDERKIHRELARLSTTHRKPLTMLEFVVRTATSSHRRN